jgi:hypothetical protein
MDPFLWKNDKGCVRPLIFHAIFDRGGTREEQLAAVEVRVSEVAFHPTTSFSDSRILEEAARLWLAGYQMGIYKVIHNREIPQAYIEKGYLSEEDTKELKQTALVV